MIWRLLEKPMSSLSFGDLAAFRKASLLGSSLSFRDLVAFRKASLLGSSFGAKL